MRLGVIGDVHTFWDELDARYFHQAGYDQLIFVGDLAGYGPASDLRTARRLSRLRVPALLMPGNHDGAHLLHVAAEALTLRPLLPFVGRLQPARMRLLKMAIAPAQLGGYSLHTIFGKGGALSVIVARPHSQGGPALAFKRYLAKAFQVRTMEDSIAKLKRLVDRAEHPILFVGHNGPFGLGADSTDIFGCDFKREALDWGDPDLAEAINYALESNKEVLASVAGHMHHRVKGGGQRRQCVLQDGVCHINAARVPRISKDGAHHHVRLTIDETMRAERVAVAHQRGEFSETIEALHPAPRTGLR